MKDAFGAGVMYRARDGRVLFLRRTGAGWCDYPNFWCFPGGGVDPGETPNQAARRESIEEVGRDPGLLGGGIAIRGFKTFLVVVAEIFTPRLNSEHTAYCWRHPSDAPSPLHPGVVDSLAAFGLKGKTMDKHIHIHVHDGLREDLRRPRDTQVLQKTKPLEGREPDAVAGVDAGRPDDENDALPGSSILRAYMARQGTRAKTTVAAADKAPCKCGKH